MIPARAARRSFDGPTEGPQRSGGSAGARCVVAALLLLLALPLVAVAACGEGDGPVGPSWTDRASGLLEEVPDLPSLPDLVVQATDGRGTDGRGTDGGAADDGATDGGAADDGATHDGATHGGAADGGRADVEATDGLASSGSAGRSGDRPSSRLDRGDEWIARWEATWLMQAARGRKARYAVYDEAVALLAERLGPDAARDALERVAAAGRELRAWQSGNAPPGYRDRLTEVEELVSWGRAALDDGDVSEAMRAALEAADRIRTVSPRSVAELLLSRARALRGINPPGFTPTDRTRVDRLLQGAERALERDEYGRAIRRAYYAARILGDASR